MYICGLEFGSLPLWSRLLINADFDFDFDFDIDTVSLKAPHRVSHSMYQERQGGTNGCSLGTSTAISFRLVIGFASYR